MNNYIKNNTGILIRIDDVCENMDWELMRKLELLFDNYSIKPVLGVIPNNKDKEFLSFPRNKQKVLNIHEYEYIENFIQTYCNNNGRDAMIWRGLVKYFNSLPKYR